MRKITHKSSTYSDDDQYDEIIQAMLATDHIYIATPVYWYSMSGRMKVLFDRLTDLVTSRKAVGRKMKGKTMSLITTSGSEQLDQGYSEVFEKTADYLDMNWGKTYFRRYG